VESVIFCIGDRVDEEFGLPVRWNEFVKNPEPRFPIDGVSYEAYDPETEKPVEGVFVAGWSREASSGLVGVARKDGEFGARAVLQYLEALSPGEDKSHALDEFRARISQLDKHVVTKGEWQRLEAIERSEAERLGLEEYKFASNAEMMLAIEKPAPQPAD
jgi:ferredoxin--NADP+ reductase